jgi:hypothetical protein
MAVEGTALGKAVHPADGLLVDEAGFGVPPRGAR